MKTTTARYIVETRTSGALGGWAPEPNGAFESSIEADEAAGALVRTCGYSARDVRVTDTRPEPLTAGELERVAELTRDEEPATELCTYCGRTVRSRPAVPAVGDDAAWAGLAPEHTDGCEWVTTRAHRA